MNYSDSLILHYSSVWGNDYIIENFSKGPIEKLPIDFKVVSFNITQNRNFYVYSTINMSNNNKVSKIELHIFSPERNEEITELLYIISSFHHNDENLDLNHTVNFGKSWIYQSECKFGLVSLPYIDGPKIDIFSFNHVHYHCYWLLPITQEERNFKMQKGIESLELVFEENEINYLDINRKSTV